LNFGQTGYVSTQDLILFELQLALGNAPDVAVFYQGFNDTLSAYGHGISGLPLSEVNRARDFYTGRLLDDGHMVLRPQTNLKLDDLSLVASADGTAEGVVTRYLANVELLETLADAYDVELLFVWQPALFYKQPRSPEEETLWQANEDRRPGLIDFYQQVDRLLREQTPENMAILSDLFQDTENQVFIDPVHITEDGNLAVAQTLLPRLIEILSSNSE
jgi:lysophospholipase L1-like esterase